MKHFPKKNGVFRKKYSFLGEVKTEGADYLMTVFGKAF